MELKLKVLNSKVIVRKYDKIKKEKKSGGSPFASISESLETNDHLGEVLFSGVDDIVVGQKVYFGNTFERIFMKASEVYVMDSSNLVGIVDEE